MSRTGKGNLSAAAPASVFRRAPAVSAVVAAAAFGILLGMRTIITPDVGYHLAYGEHFLDTGRLVDTNEYIYTLPAAGAPDRPEPGPGCWYDADGRYRFPNANWLTQVIMAAAYRAGGGVGLSLLQAAVIAGIVLLSLRTMRRLGVPGVWQAAGLILTGMVAQGRFNVRPELFGYLLLAGQLSLLADGPRGKRAAVALVVMQLLLVNLHSYFILGLALTGAVLADRLVRLGWARLRGGQQDEASARIRQEAKLLGAVLGGQVAVCFANPWTWRLAVLPVQTLLYMRKHHIASGGLALTGHPWSHIGEFFRPFAAAFFEVKATYAYVALLGLAGLGALASAVQRRWDWLAVIAGMALISLSMRRNIAPAAIIITPLALAALWEIFSARAWKLPARGRAAAAGAVALVSVFLATSVVTQRYYYGDHSMWRFGLGISRLFVPLGAAEWLGENRPAGRLWTDYTGSSNLHYFTRPHPDVPVMTNTWAYPPQVMREVLDYCSGQRPFEEVERSLAPEVVVLRMDRGSIPLGRRLANAPDWAVVHIGGMYVVFLRTDGPNAPLAERLRITPGTLDLPAHKARLGEMDPVRAYSTCMGAMTLYRIGWDSPAIDVFRRAVELDADYYQAWDLLGLALARRGTLRLARQDHRGKQDWNEALACFDRALRIEPDYKDARSHRMLVSEQIASLKRGVLLTPVFP